MQLNITEFDDTLYDNNSFQEENYEQFQSEYEKIPENIVPIKKSVPIKKIVHFSDSTLKPVHQSIPRENAKVVRPHIPQQKPKISYEDILSKMGMFVSDGKLHLIDRNTLTSQPQHKQYQEEKQSMDDSNIPKNSYIYNKYFHNFTKNPDNNVRRPRTLHEYKMMLIDDYIQRHRIKQMKSTKLLMPTSNINISGGNIRGLQNKLFNFSKR